MSRIPKDCPGIWAPIIFFQDRELRANLEAIMSCFYFNHSMHSSNWQLLEKKGLAEKAFNTPEQIKEFLCKKKPQEVPYNTGINTYKCTWCNCETFEIHFHHYPKPKKDGASHNGVHICGTCHAEFHALERAYKFTQKFYSLFDGVENE